MRRMLTAVAFAICLLGVGLPGVVAAQDFKNLEGKWDWRYSMGSAHLQIENVKVVDGVVTLETFYKSCRGDTVQGQAGVKCSDYKGYKITSRVDPVNSKVFIQRSDMTFDLTWHGGKKLVGQFTNKDNMPQVVEFNKNP